MTEQDRHITWPNFEANYVRPGSPVAYPISGVPAVTLFVDEAGKRLGLRTPVARQASISPSGLVEIQVRQVFAEGQSQLEISTESKHLFREFFALALSLSDRVQLEKVEPTKALQSSMRSWRSLFEPLDVLPEGAQLGLIGELWFLRQLIPLCGGHATQSWLGPTGDSHDFRLGEAEFEVKSSTAQRHGHTISSLGQLMPSPNCDLFVISLEYGDAGLAQGDSLIDAVAAVRATIAAEEVDHFEAKLKAVGFSDAHAPYYATSWKLRSLPRMVPVDENCPRLTSPMLEVLGAATAARISDVSYRVLLDGLGFDTADPRYTQQLQARAAALWRA